MKYVCSKECLRSGDAVKPQGLHVHFQDGCTMRSGFPGEDLQSMDGPAVGRSACISYGNTWRVVLLFSWWASSGLYRVRTVFDKQLKQPGPRMCLETSAVGTRNCRSSRTSTISTPDDSLGPTRSSGRTQDAAAQPIYAMPLSRRTPNSSTGPSASGGIVTVEVTRMYSRTCPTARRPSGDF